MYYPFSYSTECIHTTEKDAQTHACEVRVVGRLPRGRDNHGGHGMMTQIVSAVPVDDDDESDGAQADDEFLVASRVRMTGTNLANVDTSTTRR